MSRERAYGDGRGDGVRVAVVDSGIEAGHPMVGAVVESVAVVADADATGGVRFVEGPHEDLYGHGTACAGIIREVAPGVAMSLTGCWRRGRRWRFSS